MNPRAVVLVALIYGAAVGSCFGRPAWADVDQLRWAQSYPPPTSGWELVLIDQMQNEIARIELSSVRFEHAGGDPASGTGVYSAAPAYVSPDGRGAFGYIVALDHYGARSPASNLRYFDSCHDVDANSDGVMGAPDFAAILGEIRGSLGAEALARAFRRYRTVRSWLGQPCP